MLNDVVLELKQPVLWNYTKSANTAHDFSAYSQNKYFPIEVYISPTAKALLFVGWPYAGHKAQLTIVAFVNNQVKVVLNKEAELKSVTKTGTQITGFTALEYNTNGTTILRTISAANGTLYIK
jgi:hypothetical protein